jgi:hypothetical protein
MSSPYFVTTPAPGSPPYLPAATVTILAALITMIGFVLVALVNSWTTLQTRDQRPAARTRAYLRRHA